MANSVSNIVIEPVDLYWGSQHTVNFTMINDVGGALDTQYVKFSTPTTKFYLLADGGGADPAPAGYTKIEITLVDGDSASVIAGKFATAINAADVTNGLHAIAKGAVLTVQAKAMGAPIEAASIGTMTGVAVAIVKPGSLLEMGYTDGDVEIGTEIQKFDVTAHQTGTELLAALVTGSSVGPISVTLKEATLARLKEFIAIYGEEYTPSEGMTPSEVSGWGGLAGTKQFSNLGALGRKLVLHPTKNDISDVSGDIAFWNAFPNVSQILVSGESNRSVTVDFDIYLDDTKVNEVSKFVIGDHTQNFLK